MRYSPEVRQRFLELCTEELLLKILDENPNLMNPHYPDGLGCKYHDLAHTPDMPVSSRCLFGEVLSRAGADDDTLAEEILSIDALIVQFADSDDEFSTFARRMRDIQKFADGYEHDFGSEPRNWGAVAQFIRNTRTRPHRA